MTQSTSSEFISPIKSVAVGEPVIVPKSDGDTWVLAWAKDGNLYSPSNDTKGFDPECRAAAVMFHEVKGDRVEELVGETVNYMSDYRFHADYFKYLKEEGNDLSTWKTSGCIAVDGALYLLVSRHIYGQDSGDKTMRQSARNASLIKSLNGGQTWVRSAQENIDKPMFPGNHFAAPYFISFGQDGNETIVDQSDRYVYAISNNGFWDNGDTMVLGRVLRSKLPDLNGADWEFYKAGDGASDSSWTSQAEDAIPVISNPNHLGSTGAVYLPAQKCYFLVGWYYTKGGGKIEGAHCETNWDFYVAPHPWGPWKIVGSHTFNPQGYYCPTVCPKFTEDSKVWVITAGDWTNPEVYRLTGVPVTLN